MVIAADHVVLEVQATLGHNLSRINFLRSGLSSTTGYLCIITVIKKF